MKEILIPVLWFIGISAFFGVLLAIAAKIFATKTDPKAEAIKAALPGANCGGCGYTGCAVLAEKIAAGEAKTNACAVGGDKCAKQIAEILGVKAEATVKKVAKVMCSGTNDKAKSKYKYEGEFDCNAAMKLGYGQRTCSNGCIGLGTCAAHCPFEAISVSDGLARVDKRKCVGCGTCIAICPKGIIKLVPSDLKVWVGCSSLDRGVETKNNCSLGCIGCKICEKNCESGAIKVADNVASIDYEKCTGCGVCVEKCPRKIIRKI